MKNGANRAGLGIALGAALGAVLGAIAGNGGVWIAVGIALGVALGTALRRKEGNCTDCAEIHRRCEVKAEQLKAES